MSKLDDVSESFYYESPLGYNKVDWNVNEVIKLENKLACFFKNTNKDIIMTKQDEEGYRSNNVCRLSEKKVLSDKV